MSDNADIRIEGRSGEKWTDLLGFPVVVEPGPPPVSHPRETLRVQVRPFVYLDADGSAHICYGGELEIEGLDLKTEVERGRVVVRGRARGTLELMGEKEPKP